MTSLPEPSDSISRTFGFERLAFFSDAVFAIAITLLVLDLRLPVSRAGGFLITPLIPKFIGFGVSFFVIGIYWLAHHRLFQGLRAENGALRVANLVFLASIAFLPFPTSVVSDYAGAPDAVSFYAISVSVVGLLLVLLTLVARRPGLMWPAETRGGTARLVARSLGAPAVFVATAFVATQSGALAMLLWLAVAPVVEVCDRLGKRLQHQIDSRSA